MNKKQVIMLIGLIGFFLCLSSVTQARKLNVEEGKISDLTLEVKTVKDRYLPLEPIRFIIKLSNQTDKPIKSEAAIDFSRGLLIGKIVDAQGGVKDLGALQEGRLGFLLLSPALIQPGEFFERKEILTYQLLEKFPEYKTYELLFLFRGLETINCREAINQCSISNKVKITIDRPEGLNEAAFNFQREKYYSRLTANLSPERTDNPDDWFQELEEFVVLYGESIYGIDAIERLASAYRDRENYSAAKQFYQRLLNRLDEKNDIERILRVRRELYLIDKKLRLNRP